MKPMNATPSILAMHTQPKHSDTDSTQLTFNVVASVYIVKGCIDALGKKSFKHHCCHRS